MMRTVLKLFRWTFRTMFRFLVALVNLESLYYNRVRYKTFPNIKGMIWIQNQGEISFGKGVNITSQHSTNPLGGNMKTTIKVYRGGEVLLSDNVGLSNVAICCRKGIRIGANTLIGGGACIYDTDFHSINISDRNKFDDIGASSEIVIGSNVFIGAHSLILKGVNIGDGSVIGARSVVTKNIPSGQVWGGNPAKFISNIG